MPLSPADTPSPDPAPPSPSPGLQLPAPLQDFTEYQLQGLCYYTAPKPVTDDRGFGVVIGDGGVPDSERAVAEQAESLCPEQALHLLAEAGN